MSGNRILSALTALLQRTTRRFSLGQLTITRCKDDDDEEEDDYDDDDDDNDDDDDDDDDDVNDPGYLVEATTGVEGAPLRPPQVL